MTKREDTNQSIRALTDREQARTKLPVFYGSFDNFEHGLKETLMNGRDEVINNFEEGEVVVVVEEDLQTIEIFDTGRGIPLQGETDGIKNHVLLFETLFAGGNYDNLEEGKTTTGQNGCGSTTLNFTSSIFEVVSYKNFKSHSVLYNGGGIFQGYREAKSDIEHGTRVRFKLDDTIYTSVTYDIENIKFILNCLASTSPKITYRLNYLGEEYVFHYKDALEYMGENITNKTSDFLDFQAKVHSEKILKEGREFLERDSIKACLSLSVEPRQETYLNGTYLPEQGTIYDGVIDGLKKVFNKGRKKNKITNQDIEMCFNFHCTIDSTNPIFNGQTKFSASNVLYKKIVSDYIMENMEIVRIEKQKLFDTMSKHLDTINNFNTKNEANVKNIKKKLEEKVDGINNRVEGLVDCRTHGLEAELFICEGQSALSTCVLSRNAKNQACIAIRGKILSTLKVGYEKIFANQLVMDLMRIIGCGIQVKGKAAKGLDSFNIGNIRFGKIVITTDQDSDGASIICLLLTMFYRLAPSLIEDGYIYIAKTPLYEITYEDSTLHYAFTDKERDELLIGHNLTKCKIQRNKGLGELEPKVMASTTMNPNTRVIEKVTVEDAEKMALQFEKWLGTEVDQRKEHIEKNLHLYAKDLD